MINRIRSDFIYRPSLSTPDRRWRSYDRRARFSVLENGNTKNITNRWIRVRTKGKQRQQTGAADGGRDDKLSGAREDHARTRR